MHGRHHPGNTSCELIIQMNRNAKGVYSMLDRKIAFGLQPLSCGLLVRGLTRWITCRYEVKDQQQE